MQGHYGNVIGGQYGSNPYAPAYPDRTNGATRGVKKALLIGCNYNEHQQGALDGCIDDARKVKELLKSRFQYDDSNIVLLVDDGANVNTQPTRRNILKAMRSLVNGAQSGDSLFFQFAGHGIQTEDFSGDEKDNLNECLLPCDYRMSGCIVDDDINRILVGPIPTGCTLHALMDCCHSGTIMDLHYTTVASNTREWKWEPGGPTRIYKGTSGGTVIQFSGCSDDQEGAELVDHFARGGLATRAFIQVFEEYPNCNVTYRELLFNMGANIKEAERQAINGPNGNAGWIMRPLNLFRGRAPQCPMLSSNCKIDIDQPVRL